MYIDHTQNIIEIEQIYFSYNREEVLHDIDLSIHKGDYLGIIGPNGGGKSTLIKIMLGLLTQTSGSVKLFGLEIKRFKDWSKVGYVPQNATNFERNFPVTVEEVVAMGRYGKRGLFNLPTSEDNKKVTEALAKVEMLPYKNRLISDLSGGQQQRVFIARALVTEPEVIFLDEPTVGVDAKAQESFYLLLRKLNQSFGLTLVLVTHELDVVASEATEIACINRRLISYCKPKELLKSGHIEALYGKQLKFILHNHQK